MERAPYVRRLREKLQFGVWFSGAAISGNGIVPVTICRYEREFPAF